MVSKGNRQYHDRIAGRYDRIYDGPYWRFYRELSWRHLKSFLPKQRPGWAADLGTGTGWFGRKLLKSDFHTLFLDPSGAMLEKARQQVEAEGQRGHDTRYLQAELEDLSEIETESLDFATAQGDPLSFCRDPGKAVRELRRVLKPGACVVLSVDSRVAGLRSLQGQASPHESLELLRTGRTQWFAKRSEEAFPMKMFDTDELHALLSRGGFEVLSTIAKTCIVQRNNEAWLEDPKLRLRLLRAEERVHGRPSYFGLAGHLQVAAQRRR